MSDLYRSAISARIAKLPQLPTTLEDEHDGEREDEIGQLPSGMGPPPLRLPNPAYAPISAKSFFTQSLSLSVPSRHLDFRAYYTPPTVPVDGTDAGTVIVFHHGAGYGALSFACVAKEIHDLEHELGVFAFDARRHGKTALMHNSDGFSDEDLSIDVLVADFFDLLQTAFPNPTTAPTFLLIGHSMGGSVVVRTCPLLQEKKYAIAGVVVLDVVEGSAIDALPHMHALLNTRPEGFDSVEEAIEWHVSTRLIHNPSSARISIPSVIVPSDSPLLNPSASKQQPRSKYPYTWRTPLRSTAPYWSSWFTSLSRLFLAARTARLLVLAGAERLDTPLMVGQMQGKFQVEVVRDVGHVLHEDDPPALAQIFVNFWRRNERLRVGVKGVNVKRVGDV
ncbi:protein phosphatase methylesterase [Leucogyrophana mollusca]|uniref:Protein phosphatase methylesterase n=1 Tax=Leucogyrophana mollusca TaxID=85980 RepID=A0ACB8BSG0_9AGAM|nr:protein phosphatase methylesterase [Leucogyrophana mollusca]